MFFKDLAWEFSAEVVTILTVEVCLYLICLSRVQQLGKALLAGSLFPLSIVLIYVLENVVGWD